MVTIFNEHRRSRTNFSHFKENTNLQLLQLKWILDILNKLNMEANFNGNSKTFDSLVLLVAICSNHIRFGNMEATFRGNSCNYGILQMLVLQYVLNILGPNIWKPLLKETPDNIAFFGQIQDLHI